MVESLILFIYSLPGLYMAYLWSYYCRWIWNFHLVRRKHLLLQKYLSFPELKVVLCTLFPFDTLLVKNICICVIFGTPCQKILSLVWNNLHFSSLQWCLRVTLKNLLSVSMTGSSSPLVLDGQDLKLLSVRINGKDLKACNFCYCIFFST